MIYKNIRHALCAVLLVAFSPTVFASSALITSMLEMVVNMLTPPAKTYTLYIHGRTPATNDFEADYTRFDYWGPSAEAAGDNPRAVNVDGTMHISERTHMIQRALDCYCTGSNWCNIGAHSAGNLHIGYAIANYQHTQRPVKVPDIPAAGSEGENGVCESAGNSTTTGLPKTQTGWNIRSVRVAAGAGGGSELAYAAAGIESSEAVVTAIRLLGLDIFLPEGSWLADIANDRTFALDFDLVPQTARNLYDHNNTAGLTYKLYTGSNSYPYIESVLLGEDDYAVGYHSSGGMSERGRYCNERSDDYPTSPCYKLELANLPANNGVPKWWGHYVDFRDDNHLWRHTTQGVWGGPVRKMQEAIANLISTETRSAQKKSKSK